MPVHLKCPECDTEFRARGRQVQAAGDGKPIYCSRDCQKKASRVEIVCIECGTKVLRERWRVNQHPTDRQFCSAACRNKAGSKPKTGRHTPCENGCGQDVWVIPAEEGKAHLCSVACKDDWQRRHRTMRPCAHCDKGFEVRPSDPDRYCSRQCHGAARRAPIGHRYVTDQGYVNLWIDDGAGGTRKVLEHRHVMAQHLGRPLFIWETVDHLTGGKPGRSNNALSNLRLMVGKHPRGHEPEHVVRYARQMLGLYGTPDEQTRYAEERASLVDEGPAAQEAGA